MSKIHFFAAYLKQHENEMEWKKGTKQIKITETVCKFFFTNFTSFVTEVLHVN